MTVIRSSLQYRVIDKQIYIIFSLYKKIDLNLLKFVVQTNDKLFGNLKTLFNFAIREDKYCLNGFNSLGRSWRMEY